MELDPIVWAAILLLLGLTLAVLELFVPSGGLIGLLSVLSIVASIALAFRHGSWTGLGFMGLTLIGLPLMLVLALQIWPRTPMGRRLLLAVPRSEEVLPDNELRRELKGLVGRVGKARSLMLPSGPVEIDGRVYDALSQGMAIEPGTWVKVVEVRGTRIVVQPSESAPPPRDPDDPLAQPIDRLGLDPFEDPLA